MKCGTRQIDGVRHENTSPAHHSLATSCAAKTGNTSHKHAKPCLRAQACRGQMPGGHRSRHQILSPSGHEGGIRIQTHSPAGDCETVRYAHASAPGGPSSIPAPEQTHRPQPQRMRHCQRSREKPADMCKHHPATRLPLGPGCRQRRGWGVDS